MPPSRNGGAAARLAHLGHAGAEHAAAAGILAVLIVEIVRGVERTQRSGGVVGVGHRSIVAERPAIEAARSPAHAVQRVVVGVVDDGADVIGDAKRSRSPSSRRDRRGRRSSGCPADTRPPAPRCSCRRNRCRPGGRCVPSPSVRSATRFPAAVDLVQMADPSASRRDP